MDKRGVDGRRWVRGPEDVALRVRLEDLRQGLRAGIVVDPGVLALFIEDGKVRDEIGPGNYTLETLLDRLSFWKPGRVVDVVLVARGPHALAFAMEDAISKDEQIVRVEFELLIEILRARTLSTAMLPAPGWLDLEGLASRVRAGMRRAVDVALGREVVVGGFDRAAMAASLRTSIELAIERQGLNVLDLGPLRISGDAIDSLREARAGDAVSAAEADRLGRRLEVMERLREAVRGDREGIIRDERALERVIDDIDRERLLEAHEREHLKSAFADEDRASERLREIIEDEHARARAAAQGAFERGEQLDSADATIEKQKRAHRAEQELRRDEHGQDVAEALDGIGILREMKRAKSGVQIEEESARLALEKRRSEIDGATRDRDQNREIERLRVLDELRSETLVAAADDVGKAALLEQMARTKQAANLTPEQLLALVSGTSGEAAAALAKKFESASDRETKALYERMIQMQKESNEKAQEMALGLANKAMETQASVAREASRRTPERVEVATPRPSRSGRCQSCGNVLPARAQVCPECASPTSS